MDNQLYGRFRVSAEFLDPKPSDKVLSVGCKEAELETRIRGRVASITCVDIDKKTIDKNRERFPGIAFEYGDIIKGLPYPDNTFDKILFLEVLEHLPKNAEPAALKELYRVLRPGGTFVLSTPNAAFFTTVLDPAFWFIGHRHYKIGRVRELLTAAGFKIDKEYIGGGAVEMLWIPFFYILLRFKAADGLKKKLDPVIDRSYRRRGFQTILVRCGK